MYLDNRISLTIIKFFRCYQRTIGISKECVNRSRSRVSECHCYLIAIRVINLEASSGIRNCLSTFGIDFYHIYETFKVSIVDNIAISLSVLCNEHIKVIHQFTTFPTGSLVYCVDTIRHIFCLTKTVFITHDYISFIFFGCFIASGRFEIDFKSCSILRSFNLCFAIVSMFDDSDISFDNLLYNIIRCEIVFYRIKFWFSTYFMNGRIEQVPLRRSDFSDSPIIITNIFICGKLTVFISYILINKGIALVNAINCTTKRCVALSCSFLNITLCYSYCELLENVSKVTSCDFFPTNRCCLIFRNYITDCCINFFDGIRVKTTNKHIIKSCHTILICYCILINCDTGQRSSVKVECHTLNQVILRRFDYLKVATFENITESNLCHLTSNYRYSSDFLWLISVVILFCYGINPRHKVINLNLTTICCRYCLIYTVAGYSKFDSINDTIFT